MTDLEISKALALAIGWREDQLKIFGDVHWGETEEWRVPFPKRTAFDSAWRTFDYRDWNVISPIAAKFDLFPRQTGREWAAANWNKTVYADTPQKAIALAVIAGAQK